MYTVSEDSLQNFFLQVRLRGTHRTRVRTSLFKNTQDTFGGISGEEPMTRTIRASTIRASRLVGSGKMRCGPNEDALKYVRDLTWWLWSRVVSKTINPSNDITPVVFENDALMVTLLAVIMQLVSPNAACGVLGHA